MSHWSEIRARAREKHGVLAAAAGIDRSPRAILNAADTATGHQRIPLPAGDPLLYGADACLYGGFVWFNSELERWRITFNQAHEYAHLWLHGSPTRDGPTRSRLSHGPANDRHGARAR